MLWAMGFQRNTQKPKENLAFSWFGAAQEHASESFFRDFSVLGALWSTSGRTLATLGRSVSALGSSLAALGGHLAPTGSTRDPLDAVAGRGVGEGNSVLEPYGIRQTAKFRWQRAIMPYAMGFQRNTQKTPGKPSYFMFLRCSGPCFGEPFS